MSTIIAQTNNAMVVETNVESIKKKYRNFESFINSHKHKKENISEIITNTRIGNESNHIFGGSYSISEEEYSTFLQLYVKDVISKNLTDHFTEKQLEKGPLLIDLDFRFESSVMNRIYTEDDIYLIVEEYLEVLKTIYIFDDTTSFPVFVFQKPNVNILSEKNLTKDGLHIIIGIMANRQVQQYIRNQMIEKLPESLNLPIINNWSDVLDEGISKGHTNWQLYGSCKPLNETYTLTHHMQIKFDTNDNEFEIENKNIKEFNLKKDICLLSARYTKHYDPFLKSDAISKISSIGAVSPTAGTGGASIRNKNKKVMNILDVKNREDLLQVYQAFIESISNIDDHKLLEIVKYTMILPSSYYENGSYIKWLKVGWALHNISDRLFVVWVMFSSQSSTFDYQTIITDMWDRWNKCEDNSDLTHKSIIYWAMQDAKDKFNEVKLESLNYYIEQTLNSAVSNTTDTKKPMGCTDCDIATVLHHMMKDLYVCASISADKWFQFDKHRWIPNDKGTSLRLAISTKLRSIYIKKVEEMLETKESLPEDDDRRTVLKNKIDKANNIIVRLGSTNDKKNIMTEAKELFYDRNFIKNIDTNPYLLCFNNGVWDFKNKVFRNGRPEDYITMSTKIDYVEIDTQKDAHTLSEIADFMYKLFPESDLLKYMWEHLASVLIGNSTNQTFHNYIGVGENGKSVLVTLLEKCLGEYKGDVPTTLLTDKRAKVGGLTPELVQLKGVRFAVMNEPSKGEKINEGTMKQLTSALDPIQCRAPFMIEALSYIPQFKLVLLANNLMEIRSQDHGTWRRIRVVDFMSLFTDNPMQGDKDKPYQFKKEPIVEKFDGWKTIFMSLLVKKALETGGKVELCQRVIASSEAYRQKQDTISEFIADKIVRAEGYSLKKTDVNFQFTNWYKNTYGANNVPNAKEVHAYLDKMFSKYTANGWLGIRIKPEVSQCSDDGINDSDIDEPEF